MSKIDLYDLADLITGRTEIKESAELPLTHQFSIPLKFFGDKFCSGRDKWDNQHYCSMLLRGFDLDCHLFQTKLTYVLDDDAEGYGQYLRCPQCLLVFGKIESGTILEMY
jgi:hypothetical protein